MMKRRAFLVSAAVVLAGASSALAHHSAAMFDRHKQLTLHGTLITYKFMAPHAWISLTTTGEGGAAGARWDIECTSAGAMKRIGITPDNLKPGDKITVVTNPLRDGRNGGSLVSITLANGETKSNTYSDIPYGQLR
jgi:hypothetical protein